MPFDRLFTTFGSLIGLPASVNTLSFFNSQISTGTVVMPLSVRSMCSKLSARSATWVGISLILFPTAVRVESCFRLLQETPSSESMALPSTLSADNFVKGANSAIEPSLLKDKSKSSREPAMLSQVSGAGRSSIALWDRSMERTRLRSLSPGGTVDILLPFKINSTRLSLSDPGKYSWKASCDRTPGGNFNSTRVKKEHLSSVVSKTS
mmetsp:Transcript_106723/g.299929  ORF Transcript_106723/g.299929 Transcript_106723/m.299929 type:complete len:208 (-) Transcript_106723:890-1513(-)